MQYLQAMWVNSHYMKNLYYVFSSCFSYCIKAEAYI